VLLLGSPGVGNTHLAVAIGRQAILAGYTVLFVPAPTLVAQLAKAHSEGRLEDRLTHFGKPKLLVVDELGYLPFEPNAAHLFFQLVSRRYERGSILITSNRSISEWGTVFGDASRGHCDPRPSAPSQPRHHHPRRQPIAQHVVTTRQRRPALALFRLLGRTEIKVRTLLGKRFHESIGGIAG